MKNIQVSVEKTATNGQSLLRMNSNKTKGNYPLLSVLMPTDIALWIKANLDKATDSPSDYPAIFEQKSH